MYCDYIEHIGAFSAVWPSSQHYSPKLRAFVDYMAEYLFPKAPPQAGRANSAKRAPATTTSNTIHPNG